MASADVIKSCLDSIRQISDQITDAIVYLDAGCLEAFQFIGAFPLLLEIGARTIGSLEDMSALDITVGWNSAFMSFTRKMVIITSRLLSDAHRYILHCLGTHQTILRCTIFTSISEIAHSAYVDSPLGPDAFREYESLLLQDYEEIVKKKCSHHHNENEQSTESDFHEKSAFEENVGSQDSQLASSDSYDLKLESSCSAKLYDGDPITYLKSDGPARLVVSVHHFPLIMCPLSPRVFVLPSEGTIAEACLSNDHEDSLSPGLPSICTRPPSDGEDVPPGVTLTAHFLYHLAAKMDLKMEIFSLGDTSRIIGKMLTDMSSLYDVGRRNRRSAGLLLIDRTLDLLTPCCHGDSLLDRMLSSLPRMNRTTSPLPVKISENQSKHSPVHVRRVPLDAKITFETIFCKEEPAMSSTQVSESITAFISGWNCELADHVDTVHINASNCELSLLNGPFLPNYSGTYYLEALLDKRAKDGAILIKNLLLEVLQRDKIFLTTKVRLGLTPAAELHALVKMLVPNSISLMKSRGIIQLALAAKIALSEPHSSRWDAFVSAERILDISSADTSQSLSSQIRDHISRSILVRPNEPKSIESSQGLLSFRDAVLLSMIGYILAGENFPTSGLFSWEEEHSLKEAVMNAILENPKSAEFQFLHGLEKELEANSSKGESYKDENTFAKPSKIDDFDDPWGSWDDEDIDYCDEQEYGGMQLKLLLQDRVDRLFKLFHKLSGLKWRNPSLREGPLASGSNFQGDTYTRKGLLYKLLTSALAKCDIPGLEYHSSAVGRFFKSGFGRFGLGQAKPSFGDQDVLLVFVVGGISSIEVREAMEAVSECCRPDSELILGGTTLVIPDDMFELLWGSTSYI